MRSSQLIQAARQSGFTLIELVIVIVIIAILAAVAIPNMGSTAGEARLAKQQAVLGALKGAWGVYYSTNKTAPTCAQVASSMADPTCTGSATAITCPGVQNKAGTADASFSCTDAGIATSPAGITCATTGC